MTARRAPRGLLVAAVGAAIVAVATFQPWYSISITPAGAAVAQQQLTAVAQQYGNPSLQALASQMGSRFHAVAGKPIATVSAQQVLRDVSKALWLLAGAALLVAVLRLGGMIEAGGGWIALVGIIGVLAVLFRIVFVPNPAVGYISLSLSWGIWLALAGASAVALGGLGVGSPDGHL
jgi:hypothetical protein